MALTEQQLSTFASRREQFIAICEGFPETTLEAVGEHHLCFKVRKKTYAYYLFDHHGDGRIAMACKSTRERTAELTAEDPETYFVPAYLGASGWVGVRLDTDAPDWATIAVLAREAYRHFAPKRLLGE